MGDLTGFAKNLKRIREERGLKQTELATKIKVTSQTISAYEKGGGEKGKNPTLEKAIDIADQLEVSLDELCGRRQPSKSSEIKTLGDFARLIMEMRDWKTVSIGKKCFVEWDETSTREIERPAIVFNSGHLMKFVEDFEKLLKLYNDETIDKAMFNDWLVMKSNSLDEISVDTQTQDSPPPWEDIDELPF